MILKRNSAFAQLHRRMLLSTFDRRDTFAGSHFTGASRALGCALHNRRIRLHRAAFSCGLRWLQQGRGCCLSLFLDERTCLRSQLHFPHHWFRWTHVFSLRVRRVRNFHALHCRLNLLGLNHRRLFTASLTAEVCCHGCKGMGKIGLGYRFGLSACI